MTASNILREDHTQIKRLREIVVKSFQILESGKEIPISDLELITTIISEFLDSIHYAREENSYFPCVAAYGSLKKEIRALLIEHEFSRRIAKSIEKNLQSWKEGKNSSEPVVRFLRTYSIYLDDHISKEEDFFDKAEKTVLSKEEEMEMYSQFLSDNLVITKIEDMIKQITYLENQPWFKN
jgi:hemerythrin-like domain-containing protein